MSRSSLVEMHFVGTALLSSALASLVAAIPSADSSIIGMETASVIVPRLLIDARRLGTFGFFVGPEGSDLNGNYALSDMVSALQWVQENIAVCMLPFGHNLL